ncbi:MAG: hypothetical protein ABI614_24750 [Planctomycetota bacterium]
MDWRHRKHRRRNCNEPGHAHALTFTCYQRFQFLAAERTCEWLANAIDKARVQFDFAVWAFAFMPEHVHMVIFPRQKFYDIADIRKAIKEPVGRQAIGYLAEHAPDWLTKVTRQRGRRTERLFWQSGGGFDENIEEPKVLREVIDYIHLNPVRRALVERARDWKWSSAGWFEGTASCLLIPDKIPPEWCI